MNSDEEYDLLLTFSCCVCDDDERGTEREIKER